MGWGCGCCGDARGLGGFWPSGCAYYPLRKLCQILDTPRAESFREALGDTIVKKAANTCVTCCLR